MAALSLKEIPDLERLLRKAVSRDLIKGKLDQYNQEFIVFSIGF